MNTIIKTLKKHGRSFTIVKNADGFYLAIEDKYITDGKLNTTLNGIQMNASKDLEKCIQTTIDHIEIEYLMNKKGFSKAQAFCKVMGMEYSETMEMMFQEIDKKLA